MVKKGIEVKRKKKNPTTQVGMRIRNDEEDRFNKYVAVYGVDEDGKASKSLLLRKALDEFMQNNPLPDDLYEEVLKEEQAEKRVKVNGNSLELRI